jgi:hypothetical protein
MLISCRRKRQQFMMFILHKKVCHSIRKHCDLAWNGSSDCYSIWNEGQGERDTRNTAPVFRSSVRNSLSSQIQMNIFGWNFERFSVRTPVTVRRFITSPINVLFRAIRHAKCEVFHHVGLCRRESFCTSFRLPIVSLRFCSEASRPALVMRNPQHASLDTERWSVRPAVTFHASPFSSHDQDCA